MYWPKEGTELYGVIQVELLDEKVLATYTIRKMIIKHTKVTSVIIRPHRCALMTSAYNYTYKHVITFFIFVLLFLFCCKLLKK